MEVSPASVLAVVGASGSGKSSLASLLLRYYDPDEGEDACFAPAGLTVVWSLVRVSVYQQQHLSSSGNVLVDDYETKKLAPTWLRRNMGVVSQVCKVFCIPSSTYSARLVLCDFSCL